MPRIGYKTVGTGTTSLATLNDTALVGDGTAEDIQIRFDGNTVDYHMGLDDSTDLFTFGVGSTLGTNAALTFDSDGHIRKPLQPAFLAHANGDQSNIAINTDVTVNFGTEIIDTNNDFNNSTSTFTAPVTGTYKLGFNFKLDNMDTGAGSYQVQIITSNGTYMKIEDPASWGSSPSDFTNGWMDYIFTIADMDAADTAVFSFRQVIGTAQCDLVQEDAGSGTLFTYCYGHLIG
jgi:hypothetical protein